MDMLPCLVAITKNLMAREYIKANDWYLKMAIGEDLNYTIVFT